MPAIDFPAAAARWDYDEENARRGSPFLADVYHLRQLAIGFNLGLNRLRAVHDYFARSPILGSYLFVSGNEKLLKYISAFRFQDEDLAKVEASFPDLVSEDFLAYLEDFRFRGDIWAVPEGQIVFGQNEPIIKVVSDWLEGWFLETLIMSTMNSGLTYATNATHFVAAAHDRPVIDFGLRRALGDGGRIQATRSVYAGGVAATSNIQAGINLGLPLSGTMSHEMVQALTLVYGSEQEAFQVYIREAIKQKNALVLLVDTFEIEQGAKHAIAALQAVSAEIGRPLRAEAFRIDSGDLYAAAQKIRALDPKREWFDGIFLTNDLGPEEIRTIAEKDKLNRYVSGFGAGTKLLNPPEVVGGVYKLSALRIDGAWTSTLKLSGSPEKSTLPGNKTLYRELDPDGNFARDIICLADEPPIADTWFPLLQKVMAGEKIIIDPLPLRDIQQLGQYNLSRLPDKYRIYRKQEVFPVEISPALEKLRRETIQNIRAPNFK